MFSEYLNQFNTVLENTVATKSNHEKTNLDELFQSIHQLLASTKEKRKSVYLIGNGGSSAIVSHGAIDFLNACGFKAYAITDNSLLTCMANDYGYENVFSQPFSTLLDQDDVVIAISSSGNSMNIVNACKMAKEKNAQVITFSGFKPENKLRSSGDLNLWLNDTNYGRVEIGHSLLLHYITDRLAIKK